MALWKKFANTLKLRILVNQSGMTGRDTYIKANLATTASVGYLGPDEGALLNPGFVNSAGKMNPFWERFYKQDGSQQADGLGYFVPGQDACDFLTNNNDPRKLRFFTAYTGTTIQGNYFGTVPLNLPSVTSKLGPGMLRLTTRMLRFSQILKVSSSRLKQYREHSLQVMQKLYMKARLQQSILLWELLHRMLTLLIFHQPKPLVSCDASPNKLEAIITQKWIALNGISPSQSGLITGEQVILGNPFFRGSCQAQVIHLLSDCFILRRR